jgi:hypothetical protein
MIVTAHQPNFLPGRSVIEKIDVSDAVVWLDEVQYTKGGYTNRNRMSDGRWITVPVERNTDGAPINRVRIADHGDWRRKMSETLRQHTGASFASRVACHEIAKPYRLLVGLNVALLHRFAPGGAFDRRETGVIWHFQSHLDGGHAVVSQGEDAEALLPISARLAMMVEEVGGDCYLSGPSGRRYLDEAPFNERRIRVEYFDWKGGPNENALELAERSYA